MNLSRRKMILASSSALGLAACMSEPAVVAGPGNVVVSAAMAGGANPGPGGGDRPLTVTLVQLRSTDAFDASDFVALQDPAASLAADLVRTDTIVLAPGGAGSASIPVEIAKGATAIGVIAGYRDPSGKVFRRTTALPATGDLPLNISIAAAGLNVS